MGPSQDLDDLLRRCTVRLHIPRDGSQGTGFWVAPGLVLTCAHVVETAQAQSAPVEITGDGRTVSGQIVAFLPKPYPDLALLRCNELQNHPCAYVHADIALQDRLYSYGYTDLYSNGDSATFEYEGPTDTGSGALLKLKEGQSRPGLSGAPLLNLRTGGVCGIVKSSRNVETDLGGRAVPITCIPAEHDLTASQQSYHQQNSDWLDCLNDRQRPFIPGRQRLRSIRFYPRVRYCWDGMRKFAAFWRNYKPIAIVPSWGHLVVAKLYSCRSYGDRRCPGLGGGIRKSVA